MSSQFQDIAVRLTAIHADAHRLGLHKTGQALHRAVQEVGWEIADKIAARAKAAASAHFEEE